MSTVGSAQAVIVWGFWIQDRAPLSQPIWNINFNFGDYDTTQTEKYHKVFDRESLEYLDQLGIQSQAKSPDLLVFDLLVFDLLVFDLLVFDLLVFDLLVSNLLVFLWPAVACLPWLGQFMPQPKRLARVNPGL